MIVGLQLTLPMQTVCITTKVLSSNATHGEVYSILFAMIELEIKYSFDVKQ
jgi:hypothetical protein